MLESEMLEEIIMENLEKPLNRYQVLWLWSLFNELEKFFNLLSLNIYV
jgi:hypothetical protein